MDLKWETVHTYEVQTQKFKFQSTANSMTVVNGILTLCHNGIPTLMVKWDEVNFITIMEDEEE